MATIRKLLPYIGYIKNIWIFIVHETKAYVMHASKTVDGSTILSILHLYIEVYQKYFHFYRP